MCQMFFTAMITLVPGTEEMMLTLHGKRLTWQVTRLRVYSHAGGSMSLDKSAAPTGQQCHNKNGTNLFLGKGKAR